MDGKASIILTLLAGPAVPFGPVGQLSAIHKLPLTGRMPVGWEGLLCDQQGDRVRHGGVEKALHHYAFEHYQTWLAECPPLAPVLKQPGAFGENFSTLGMTEANVCIGDVYRAGSILVQVSQPRRPCWKLNRRFGMEDMARRVQDNMRTGWYYRVLEEGEVAAGDALQLVQRPCPDWPLERVLRCFFHATLDYAELRGIANLPELTDSWRQAAALRIEQRVVESWDKRLNGSES
jgi:MOSC domain-containing protein YiiM